MATGAEHYRAAERLLNAAVLDDEALIFEGDADKMLAAAQVHATLALAAATAYEADTGSRLRDYGCYDSDES